MDNNRTTSEIYLAFDADSAGRKVGNAILHNNPQELYEVSQKIQHGNDVMFNWAQKWNGKCYSSGGDQGLFAISPESLNEVEQIRKDYEFTTGLTVSIGVGNTLSEAGKALLVAKFKGKNQTVIYDESAEVEILEAQNRIAEGNASEEERKLGEAYLKPEDFQMENKSETDDCKYCNDADHDESTCPYCQEMDAEQADHEHTGDDCPYCQEAEQSAIESHTHEDGAEADCPYCQESNQEVENAPAAAMPAPEAQQDSQTPPDPTANPPTLNKPNIDDGMAPKLAPRTDIESPENAKLEAQPENQDASIAQPGDIFNQDEESAQAMQDIVSSIDDESTPPQSEMDDIDDDRLPVDGSMEENVSRPNGYEENTAHDLGLAEDEAPEEGPDLSGVLQDGLDNHADNIQREKVVQMVGQALEGFKSSKDVLEKAREQAPQLYQASIDMLKAMIAMADMLGLAGGDEEQQIEDAFPSDAAPEQEQNDSSLADPESADGQNRSDDREPAHFQHPSKHAPAKGETPPKKSMGQ